PPAATRGPPQRPLAVRALSPCRARPPQAASTTTTSIHRPDRHRHLVPVPSDPQFRRPTVIPLPQLSADWRRRKGELPNLGASAEPLPNLGFQRFGTFNHHTRMSLRRFAEPAEPQTVSTLHARMRPCVRAPAYVPTYLLRFGRFG